MTRSDMYDQLANVDTSRLTTADVADMLGCSADRAGEIMRRMGKDFIRRPPVGRPPFEAGGFPVPLMGDTEAHWERLIAGRSFRDSGRAAPPRVFARIPGPELTHTAGGVSA